jgi:hypothetical protein
MEVLGIKERKKEVKEIKIIHIKEHLTEALSTACI